MPNNERDTWDRPIESLFAQVGYCVGLGNLWRFPYLCQKNGGGVFLIPYCLALMVISIPLYIVEVGIGQLTNRGKAAAWNRLPLMKGIGYASVVLTVVVMIPYMLVMAWSILYLGHSMTTEFLPWTTCDNPWNTNSCVTLDKVMNNSLTKSNASLEFNQSISISYTKESLSQVQFWRNYVLRISNPENGIDGEFNWPMLCATIAAFITVFLVTVGGIKVGGKVVYFTASFPYVILVALLIRGVTLEGASKGIRAYLFPNLSHLAKAQVWVDAVSQATYTFGIGFAALTAFGGYNRHKNNFYRSTFVVVCLGCVTSLTMGLATFSVLGHLAHVMGIDINNVVQSGPGLVFQVFPVALALMPASKLWTAMFFLMIYFVAIDTSFSEFEGLMAVIGDAFPATVSTRLKRAGTNTILGTAFFAACLSQLPPQGIYIFEMFNTYGGSGISMIFVAFSEAVTIGWLWNAEQFKRDVKQMTGSNLAKPIIYCYKFLTPLVTLFVLFFFIIKWEPLTVGDFVYPTWANVLGGSCLCVLYSVSHLL
uniref:Transporter n=1 Tax=Phallusia mammillata TaxID=59560 RepID=A0A6F9DS98_9ASCI|nr:sodium- and chloride-dependent creatine transporter 1-like [Phallusia mammillata]